MLDLGSLSFLENSRIFITGGTGSLGKQLVRILLEKTRHSTIVIYSRDEFKQYEVQQSLRPEERSRLRFFLGDVRDAERLYRGMRNVDYVIHAAALKHVPAAEYNPFEFVKTNILGAQNVIGAAIDRGVKRVVALSTDKASEPANFYGATKLCSDKLFIAGNSYTGDAVTTFSVVRYGNVVGSRGSVVPFFLQRRKSGVLPITDPEMTRFWITLEEGAALVLNALRDAQGGEIFVPRIPSMKLVDLARTVAPQARLEVVGIRPGEKLHETMIPKDAGHRAIAYPQHFVLLPDFESRLDAYYRERGETMPRFFQYSSDQNEDWLDHASLTAVIRQLDLPEAREWCEEAEIA